MSQQMLELVEKSSLKADVPEFQIGDTVDVHTRILEGEKERIQIFNGVVIARSGSGTREMFIVRRIVGGEGVERKFPLHSPKIAKIEVKRRGVVRRAKLYFLRDRVGKAVRLKERRGEDAATRRRGVAARPDWRILRVTDLRPVAGCRGAAMNLSTFVARLRDRLAALSARSAGAASGRPSGILRRLGYKIVARRERGRLGELDLVAVDGRTIVFVEVKTRTSHDAGHPAEAVGPEKQAAAHAAGAGLSEAARPAGVPRPLRRAGHHLAGGRQAAARSSTSKTPSKPSAAGRCSARRFRTRHGRVPLQRLAVFGSHCLRA